MELQSDMEDRDSSVREEGRPRSGRGAAGSLRGLSRLNSLRVGELPTLRRPPGRWKKPSQRVLELSSGWAPARMLKPSPTAASRAPQPSSTSSERRPPLGLFLLGGVSGA